MYVLHVLFCFIYYAITPSSTLSLSNSFFIKLCLVSVNVLLEFFFNVEKIKIILTD